MTGPRYTPLIDSLPSTVPFVGPETQERAAGRPFKARLGANENAFGPSPAAIKAMQLSAGDLWKYGDPESHDLKQSLALSLGVAASNIVVGEGIDALLGYLCRMLISEGDAVVTSQGAYPTFNYHVAGFGGVLHQVPYRDDHEDLGALIEAAHEVSAKLIYFANPDNPMGTWVSAEQIEAQINHLPEDSLLILDEAYIEFAPEGTAPEIEIEHPNVIRMRTFSKAYGLAGARVGYGLGAASLITNFDKIRNHFGMNRSAQIGALAALQDQGWLQKTCDAVAEARSSITNIAAANGLTALPSATNFVAIDCGKDAAFAKAVLTNLVTQGVFVRMPFVSPQDRCIRISCGTDTDLDVFAKALPVALENANL